MRPRAGFRSVRMRSGTETAVVEPERPLPDPRSYDALPGEARRPEILGHSYYTGDPAYSQALRRMITELEKAYQGP
jgi:hypothetical protein